MYRSITKRVSKTILIAALVSILLVAIPGLFLFSRKIKEEALSSEERIMEEIMNQIDAKIGVLSQEAARIMSDRDFQELYAAYLDGNSMAENKLPLVLNKMVNNSYGNGIHSIVVKTPDGKQITSISRIYSEEYTVDEDYLSHYHYYLSTPSVAQEQGSLRDEIRYVTQVSLNGEPSGYLILNIDLAAFESVFLSAQDISDRFFWLCYNNTVIYPEMLTYDRARMQNVMDIASKTNLYNKDQFYEDKIYTLVRFSNQGGIKLVVDVSTGTLYEPYRWIFVYYIGSILIIVGIILLCSLPVLIRRLSPLSRLTKHMMNTSRQTTIQPFDTLYTGDEVERLADAFNTMAASITEKNEQAVQHEKDKARIRLSLLTFQINPHFVYNTLNIITYLARQKRHDEIISVNQALITILKDRLRITEDEVLDTVEHAIGIVNQYILIQKYRYGSSFDVEYRVDEEAKKLLIPKSIIQPLVENALFHGLVPVFDENPSFWGRIFVEVTYDETTIRLCVTDNGTGMDEDQLKIVRERIDGTIETERGKHIALKNIYGRLLHIYGTKEEGDRMAIQSMPGKGTTVMLIMDRVENE